ncbi:endonuclease/exonuclease/phosphatase family protein [Spongiactinospora rosea]|uniref:endonuclease/exonuclease/phosphatase family protein n=1 Tax=Spongiactinospora rosea TaxID=2248750 RepID=UPI0013149D2D|nr:endonuclease/exonuclease/phosphatase family protein [Spongiactinospora rosea]
MSKLITDTDPDVISLVEVDESWGTPEILATLAERLGYAWVFTPTFEFGDQSPRGGFGNALLTKLPILAVQQWQLLWPTKVYDGSEPSEPRSAVFAKVGYPEQALWAGSTHLPRRDENVRREALDRLLSIANKLNEPWVVCGDFNLPASAWVSDGGPLVVAPEPAVATYPAEDPTEAIDYCVASSGTTLEAEVLRVTGSDHLAILADLLPGAAT